MEYVYLYDGKDRAGIATPAFYVYAQLDGFKCVYLRHYMIAKDENSYGRVTTFFVAYTYKPMTITSMVHVAAQFAHSWCNDNAHSDLTIVWAKYPNRSKRTKSGSQMTLWSDL